MPFFVVPLLAGAVGFGAGFWSGSTAGKVAKVAALSGAGYLVYQHVKGGRA